MERFSMIAANALTLALGEPIAPHELDSPPDRKFGDFAFACFRLAKTRKASPPSVAQSVVDAIPTTSLQGLTVSAVGPYVNFTVPAPLAFQRVMKDILTGSEGREYGTLPPNTRGRWVLEYSSPNVAKHFNIYHIRPTAIGAALTRTGRMRGWDVISINHLGDWGTQFGKLFVAMELHGDTLPAEPTLEDLVRLYVQVHVDLEKDPSIADRAREASRKLEAGDPATLELWTRCRDISLKKFYAIYDRLGIEFDHIWGESHYKDLTEPLVESLRKKGIVQESEGAEVVFLEPIAGREVPPCILKRRDGATLYATRDLAAAIYRWDKFHFDRMSYIVGGEQILHFQQIFATLRKAGYPWVDRCEHVPTGIYRFNDKKMSTRKGEFITLEDVLDTAKSRVQSLIEKRAAEGKTSAFSPESLEQTSEAVALGAVLFFDLSTDPARDVQFDVERVVDFEGETGPYLQYAHTRCLSILRKAHESGLLGDAVTTPFDSALAARLEHETEVRLIKTLGLLGYHLDRTLHYAKASHLTSFLIDVTRDFGSFYRECQVLTEDRDLSRARLMLVNATRMILNKGLGLLGIPLPDRM